MNQHKFFLNQNYRLTFAVAAPFSAMLPSLQKHPFRTSTSTAVINANISAGLLFLSGSRLTVDN